MSRVQLKRICYIEDQENNNLKEKRQATDTNIESYQMLEWSEKNLKTTIKKMLQQGIMNL